MLNIYEDVCSEKLGSIINYAEDNQNKIFRDVTVEKIQRDVVDLGETKDGYAFPAEKNPE